MANASEKLAKLRDRANKKSYIEPQKTESGTSFDAERWFDRIRMKPNIHMVQEACEYYASAVEDGKNYVVPVGNLEQLVEQYPGITFFYRSIMVDAQQSRRWLDDHIIRVENDRYKYYMFDEDAKAKYGNLKTTEAGKMAKSDPVVAEIGDAIRLLAYQEHQLEALMEAFDNIKYVLNHVVNIRKEKLEEVWIDPTRETTNA